MVNNSNGLSVPTSCVCVCGRKEAKEREWRVTRAQSIGADRTFSRQRIAAAYQGSQFDGRAVRMYELVCAGSLLHTGNSSYAIRLFCKFHARGVIAVVARD